MSFPVVGLWYRYRGLWKFRFFGRSTNLFRFSLVNKVFWTTLIFRSFYSFPNFKNTSNEHSFFLKTFSDIKFTTHILSSKIFKQQTFSWAKKVCQKSGKHSSEPKIFSKKWKRFEWAKIVFHFYNLNMLPEVVRRQDDLKEVKNLINLSF